MTAGFSHSEISGSKRICRSPKLIAAYHVLHRLVSPRHPLIARNSLPAGFLLLFLKDKLFTSRAVKCSCLFTRYDDELSKNKKLFGINQDMWSVGRLPQRRVAHGGPSWTRTSDPRVINTML